MIEKWVGPTLPPDDVPTCCLRASGEVIITDLCHAYHCADTGGTTLPNKFILSRGDESLVLIRKYLILHIELKKE